MCLYVLFDVFQRPKDPIRFILSLRLFQQPLSSRRSFGPSLSCYQMVSILQTSFFLLCIQSKELLVLLLREYPLLAAFWWRFWTLWRLLTRRCLQSCDARRLKRIIKHQFRLLSFVTGVQLCSLCTVAVETTSHAHNNPCACAKWRGVAHLRKHTFPWSNKHYLTGHTSNNFCGLVPFQSTIQIWVSLLN